MLLRLDTDALAGLLRQAGLLSGPARFAVLFWHTNEGRHEMGEITIKDSVTSLDATVTFLDAKGAETTPDDTPAWSSSDDNVASVAASDDGRSATITPGLPGAAIIHVESRDNDGTLVVAEGMITVQPGEAVIGSVDFDERPSP